MEKARALRHLHIAYVDSTHYGGGVAETLGSLTLLMNSAGTERGFEIGSGMRIYPSLPEDDDAFLRGDEDDEDHR